MLITSRHAQDFWLHGIDKDESTDVRYSLTLRHVAPHFINSTVILGDSNTQHIKFGTGEGFCVDGHLASSLMLVT